MPDSREPDSPDLQSAYAPPIDPAAPKPASPPRQATEPIHAAEPSAAALAAAFPIRAVAPGAPPAASTSTASSAPPAAATAPEPEPAAAAGPSVPFPFQPHHGDGSWSATWKLLLAHLRALSDKTGRRLMRRTLKIGVSARIFHPESGATGLRGKTLQYLEESIAQWVMSRNVLVFMIPTVNNRGMLHHSDIRLRDYAKHLDGLVLQGGADVSPQSYSESATRPEWSGDRTRDMYELELLHEFIEAGKPVLGICRGCQLINVAFGGTLYQDIASDVPAAIEHVNDLYDSNYHPITFPQGSTLGALLRPQEQYLVNSIHHQAVRELGRDVTVEAVSGDNIVEAIRYRKAPFVVGVQWHPEFHRAGGPGLMDCTPILDSFLRAARETRF